MKSLTTTTMLALTWVLITGCANELPLISAKPESSASLPVKSAPINRNPNLRLSNIASRVSSNNPQLRAARQRLEEAKGQVIQSGRLSNPELGVDLGKTILSSEAGLEVSFAQRFPITNRLTLEKRISRQQLEIARQEVAAVRQQLIGQAQQIAVDILILRKKVAQLDTQIQNLDTLANFINEAAQRGELSSLDANQANIESVTLKSKRSSLQSEQRILLGKINAYVGLPPSNPLTLSGNLPALSLPSVGLVLHNTPEYKAKTLEVHQAEQSIVLAKANRYSDIEASGFAGVSREKDAPEGFERERTVGVGVKIPLRFFDQNEGNVKAARARASRLLLEKKALVTRLRQNAASEKAEMKSWLAQSRNIADKLAPLASQNAADLEQAYRNGQSPFTSLLKARSQQLELESQEIDTVEAFHKARVRYFATIGLPDSAF